MNPVVDVFRERGIGTPAVEGGPSFQAGERGPLHGSQHVHLRGLDIRLMFDSVQPGARLLVVIPQWDARLRWPTASTSKRSVACSGEVREEESAMTNGTIKKLVSDRGFGFIAAEDGKEYFFHRDAVDNFDSLNGGEKVTFEVEASPKGPRAKLVKLSP
jgi:CspA family cold shock protein